LEAVTENYLVMVYGSISFRLYRDTEMVFIYMYIRIYCRCSDRLLNMWWYGWYGLVLCSWQLLTSHGMTALFMQSLAKHLTGWKDVMSVMTLFLRRLF